MRTIKSTSLLRFAFISAVYLRKNSTSSSLGSSLLMSASIIVAIERIRFLSSSFISFSIAVNSLIKSFFTDISVSPLTALCVSLRGLADCVRALRLVLFNFYFIPLSTNRQIFCRNFLFFVKFLNGIFCHFPNIYTFYNKKQDLLYADPVFVLCLLLGLRLGFYRFFLCKAPVANTPNGRPCLLSPCQYSAL